MNANNANLSVSSTSGKQRTTTAVPSLPNKRPAMKLVSSHQVVTTQAVTREEAIRQAILRTG